MRILLVDRNKRVGVFIKRELEKDDHEVILVGTARALTGSLVKQKEFNLLIIDPDLPDSENSELSRIIRGNLSGIPVIVHTCLSEFVHEFNMLDIRANVEKRGNSADNIRSIIKQMNPFPNFTAFG